MIRTRLKYRSALVVAFVLMSIAACAEPCHKNMLVIPDADSYVSVDLPKRMPTGALTLECWAFATGAVTSGSGLIEYGDAPDTGAFSLRFGDNNRIVTTLRLNNGIVTLLGPSIASPGSWHHYAVTFIPGDSICLYVDGNLIAGTPVSGTSLAGSYNTLFIGRSPAGGVSFVGDIDELRIWNTARTAGQISASMAQPLSGSETGLVTYFKFDDDPGAIHIHDFSGNDNNATYTGSAFLTTSTAPIQGSAPNGYMIASRTSSLTFPTLACGETTTDTVRVYNRGDESIEIGLIGFLSGKVFSVASTTGFPLPAGDSTKTALIIIQANVSKPGLYVDTLVVVSSTVCGGEVRIPVSLRKDVIAVGFQDSIFYLNKPYKLLNCNLPIERQTRLENRGTKKVTITALSFTTGSGPITIISPSVPFTIDSGSSQEIKFRVNPGPPAMINATLRAVVQECPVQTTMQFIGERVSQSFTFPTNILFPIVHDPPTPYFLYDTIQLHNTGTTDLIFSPAMQLFGASGFRLITPTNGLAVVRPDSILRIVIQFHVIECGSYQATLTLHLQDSRNCPLDTSISIGATVLEPDLATVSDSFDLGAGCYDRDTTIVLHNRSGRTVTIYPPAFSLDSVLFLSASTPLPRTLVDGDSVSLRFHFAPNKPGEYDFTARLRLDPCGDRVLNFRAIYGVGKMSVSDSVIDFGSGCDLVPQTRTIRLRNLAGRTILVNDTTIAHSGSFTLVDPTLPFVMTSGEEKTLTIRYAPTTLSAERGEITLSEDGCYVKTLVAKAVREHATVVADSNFIEFGRTCPSDTSYASVTLTNHGYGSVQIVGAAVIGDSQFRVVSIPTTSFARGESRDIPLAFLPNDTLEYAGILEVIFGPCNDTAYYTLHGSGGPKPTIIATPSMLDFGTVKVGYPDTLCLTLTNPSCIPIPVMPGMFPPLPAPFSYASISLATAIDSAHPLEMCIAFSPTANGTSEYFDTIRSAGYGVILGLHGKARAPKLQYAHVVDFGSVPLGSPHTRVFAVQNIGDTSTTISFTPPIGPFDIQPRVLDVPSASLILTDSTKFTPTTFGLQSVLVPIHYDNIDDTISLRGRGVGPGPLFSVSDIDFGPVRVHTQRTLGIDVTADKPTNITNVSLAGAQSVFSIYPTGSRTIRDSLDTIHYTITYTPLTETHDSTTIVLSTTTSNDVTLGVSGDGVEAHLSVSDSLIDFGDVALRSTPATRLLRIANTGGYPLTIANSTHVLPVFGATTDSLRIGPIEPHSDTSIVVSFKPRTDIAYTDTLTIVADAPERQARIVLRGNGVFAPFGYPMITYSLPHLGARVGDVVDVPVSLGGTDLDLVTIDTFTVDINYDPTVVYFRDSLHTTDLTVGWTLSFERRATDTIRITGRGPKIVDTLDLTLPLFRVRAEALLGPHDSTGLVVTASNPRNAATLAESAGSFIVTDCGNYRGGIVFVGPYSLSTPTPNPAGRVVTIPYELGLAARVRIELYDQLGRHIRTLLDADRGIGKHTLSASLNDLPNGEYYYVLESLEYRATQKLILVGH
ncbi:MAG: choice-of-anchor D domain-containing protein [Bacteroidetes bacterium]|nr:choice-of-anchor D domain-containing protein [Bacteroidota bacterium]